MAASTKHPRSATHEALADQISEQNRPDSPVVQDLRRQVANAFVLYANYKHYHWQTYGPLFRDLHKLFDEIAKDVLTTIDPMAERMRMIGQDLPARLPEIADRLGPLVPCPMSGDTSGSTRQERTMRFDHYTLGGTVHIRQRAEFMGKCRHLGTTFGQSHG